MTHSRKTAFAFAAGLIACLALPGTAQAQTDTAWMRLFDGKDLKGWYYDSKFWKSDSGMIIAKGNATYNNFCVIPRKFSDFEIVIHYRLWEISSDYINTGLQYRSAWIDSATHRLKGYQSDIGDGYDGSMYPEGGYPAGQGSVSRSADCQNAIRMNGWNRMSVTDNGPTITTMVNGKKCNEYQGTVLSGYIGLQLHMTPQVMEANFKDLFIRPINASFTIPDSLVAHLDTGYTEVKTTGVRAQAGAPDKAAEKTAWFARDGRITVLPEAWGSQPGIIKVSLFDADGRLLQSRPYAVDAERSIDLADVKAGNGIRFLQVAGFQGAGGEDFYFVALGRFVLLPGRPTPPGAFSQEHSNPFNGSP